MDNYELARDRAQAYFLGFDQQQLICTWNLKNDREKLYVVFLGREYAIHRKTGAVTEVSSDDQAGFEEVLSIFDLLCHPGEHKEAAGTFAPVNSLKGAPKSGGVQTAFHSSFASAIDKVPEAFSRACCALGGTPVDMGDISFRFPVFGELSVILKFYHSDEDFPAGLTFMWDENMLQFIHYETVFYIAGFLAHIILEKIKK